LENVRNELKIRYRDLDRFERYAREVIKESKENEHTPEEIEFAFKVRLNG
jgi:hypothetical protein